MSEEREDQTYEQPRKRTRKPSKTCSRGIKLHKKYIRVKSEEYHCQINKLIGQLMRDNENDKNQPLIYLLQRLPKTYSYLGFHRMYLRRYTEIAQIIRGKISSLTAEIFEKQKDYYVKTAQFNKTLMDSCDDQDRQWFNMFTQPHTLIKIALIQCFFECNQEYKKLCNTKNAFLKCAEIFSLVPIPVNCVRVLYRYYIKNMRFILPTSNHQCKSLINIFILLKIKTLTIKRRQLFEFNNLQPPCDPLCFALRLSFCQIAIFSKQQQPIYLCIRNNDRLLRQLNILASQSPDINMQKIFSLKMRFRFSFGSINKILDNIKDKKTQNNNQVFVDELQNGWEDIQMKLKHAFCCQQCFASAIFKLPQIKSCLNVSHMHIKNTLTRNCFAKATLSVFKQLYRSTAFQIKLEEMIQPFLAIKRFQFSFNRLKDVDSQEEQQDLIYTLVVATQSNKVIFYDIQRGASTRQRYLTRLKYLLPFINQICEKHKSRLYIFNRNSQCRLNIAIYSYILEYVKALAPLITEQSFGIFIETYTAKIINLYNSTQR